MDLKFRIEAGLGDITHLCFLMKLYQARGYDVRISCTGNRDFVFDCAGIPHHPSDLSWQFHRWRYDDSKWMNWEVPIWESNKPMQGFSDPVMPDLGDRQLLWKELGQVRISAKEKIKVDTTQWVKEFIKDLPRPLLALHSCGSSFSQKKNLSHEVTTTLMEMWLNHTGGSIIQLNADKQEPSFHHDRVRTHRTWRRIGVDWLCALLYECDLMIGVDSGPFHLASFTDVPCVGVFRQIQPIFCCIPNPNAFYLVSDIHHEGWERYKDDWQFCEYVGPEPDAEDVFQAAIKRMERESKRKLQTLQNCVSLGLL